MGVMMGQEFLSAGNGFNIQENLEQACHMVEECIEIRLVSYHMMENGGKTNFVAKEN